MKKEELNSEKLMVLDDFIKEVSKELNVEFTCKVTSFQRGVQRGKKYKVENFETSIYKSKSIGFQISFIPYSNNSIELWEINVNKRGNGIGSEILSSVLDVSDRTGIKVKLVPVDYDRDENTPKDYLNRLKKWYSIGFGFKKSKFPFDPYYTYNPYTEYKMVG
jgi:hypothetical protein